MILREVRINDEAEAIKAHEELKADNFTFLLQYEEGMPWQDFIDLHEQYKRGEVPEGRVPATFLLAESDGELVGRVSIRYGLNDFLFNYGGHVGYAVRPQFRGRGFATEMLRQSLKICSELGLEKVLVTCNDKNLYSAKTIENCGGVLENKVLNDPEEADGALVRRYWITL
jgi:predicted acetyltransferase